MRSEAQGTNHANVGSQVCGQRAAILGLRKERSKGPADGGLSREQENERLELVDASFREVWRRLGKELKTSIGKVWSPQSVESELVGAAGC